MKLFEYDDENEEGIIYWENYLKENISQEIFNEFQESEHNDLEDFLNLISPILISPLLFYKILINKYNLHAILPYTEHEIHSSIVAFLVRV